MTRTVRVLVVLSTIASMIPACARGQEALERFSTPSPAASAAQVESLRAELAGATSIDDLADGPIDPRQYIVGPGDRLSVTIWGRVNSARVLAVSPEGIVVVPGAGALHVGGLTLTRARERVERAVRSQIRGSDVIVSLNGVRRFKVYVLGSVARPQAIRATASLRVSELIDRAGGFTPGAARRGIRLSRADGSSVGVDITGFVRAGRLDGNPFVREGDVILVPPRGSSYVVDGAVGYGGILDLMPGDSLSTALSLAGGPLPGALLDRVEYYRFESGVQRGPFFADVTTVAGGALPLAEGDQIYVRRPTEYLRSLTVGLSGEVERPGDYVLQPGESLGGLLARAGGFTARADSTAITVERRSLPVTAAREEADALARVDPTRLRPTDVDLIRLSQSTRRDVTPVDLGAHPEHRSLLLAGGDEINVPPAAGDVRVAGEVRRPGFLPFRKGVGITSYVDGAGGFTARADRGHLLVTKFRTWHTVEARDAGPIQAGDVIWVGRKSHSRAWPAIRDALAVAASAATIYVALQR